MRHKKEMKQMAVTIYIYANNGMSIEVPDGPEDPLARNNQQLSVDERMALLSKLADKFMEFVGPNVPPLSDYAMSREGIYEDHP